MFRNHVFTVPGKLHLQCKITKFDFNCKPQLSTSPPRLMIQAESPEFKVAIRCGLTYSWVNKQTRAFASSTRCRLHHHQANHHSRKVRFPRLFYVLWSMCHIIGDARRLMNGSVRYSPNVNLNCTMDARIFLYTTNKSRPTYYEFRNAKQ